MKLLYKNIFYLILKYLTTNQINLIFCSRTRDLGNNLIKFGKTSKNKTSKNKNSSYIIYLMPKKVSSIKLETTYFAMGCFWGPQLLFDKTPGIISTRVGYMGGNEKLFPSATYLQVCSHLTNYAETVEIVFDPSKISFNELLKIFFENCLGNKSNR